MIFTTFLFPLALLFTTWAIFTYFFKIFYGNLGCRQTCCNFLVTGFKFKKPSGTYINITFKIRNKIMTSYLLLERIRSLCVTCSFSTHNVTSHNPATPVGNTEGILSAPFPSLHQCFQRITKFYLFSPEISLSPILFSPVTASLSVAFLTWTFATAFPLVTLSPKLVLRSSQCVYVL